jgi:hypothetical protein
VCFMATNSNGTPTNNNNNNSAGLEGDEASLEDFELSEGDDDELSQGDTEAEIVEIEFEVQDGDIRIERADFEFMFDGGENADDQPWEVFDSLILMADGEEIATMDASDEDEWSEDDDDVYMMRFSGLDYVVREGETAMLTLAVDVADDVEGSDDGDAVWEIVVPDEGIRGRDAENINQEIGDDSQSVTVEIDDEDSNDDDDDEDDEDDNDSDDELTIDDSSDTPDDSVTVSETVTTGWIEIFAFEIETGDNDVDLSELPITLEFLDNGSFDEVIDDIKIEIDGVTSNGYDVDGEDDDEATITFEFDDEVSLDGDDSYTAYVSVKFSPVDDNYDDGDEILASITEDDVDNIEAEGDDDLGDEHLRGSAEGEEIELNF